MDQSLLLLFFQRYRLLKVSFSPAVRRHLQRGHKWEAECRLGEYSSFAKLYLSVWQRVGFSGHRFVIGSAVLNCIASVAWEPSLPGRCRQVMLSPDFFTPSQEELLECLGDFILQWGKHSHVCAASACLTGSVGRKQLLVRVVNTVGYQN